MSRRKAIISPREPIFLGCEGESEQAYGQILNDLLRDEKCPFHLQVVTLNPGAGDPVSRICRAKQEIAHGRQRRTAFHRRAILMDSDQVEHDQPRRELAERMARDADITIIRQHPCHEAFLLRHLQGFTQSKPASSIEAVAARRRSWPQYRKPMTKLQLRERITLESVQRAATVEFQLARFLREIKLLQ